MTESLHPVRPELRSSGWSGAEREIVSDAESGSAGTVMLLKLAQASVEASTATLENDLRVRFQYVQLAREKGMTFEAIASVLGITNAGVRHLITRRTKEVA